MVLRKRMQRTSITKPSRQAASGNFAFRLWRALLKPMGWKHISSWRLTSLPAYSVERAGVTLDECDQPESNGLRSLTGSRQDSEERASIGDRVSRSRRG